MRTINKIIIHCSATKASPKIGVNEIRNHHVTVNGWADVGYHFVIRTNGQIEKGRPLAQIGAHCQGHNADSIGICLVGGLDAKGKPANTFSQEQFTALRNLVAQLRTDYGDLLVFGHNEFSNKACPCFDVKQFFWG